MGGNGNKMKQVITNNQDTYEPWPDLPDQLLRIISKRLDLLKSVGFHGVRKGTTNTTLKSSWPHLSSYGPGDYFFLNSKHRISELVWPNGSPEDPILDSSQGELLMRSQKSGEYYIWSPPGAYKRGLPRFDKKVSFGNIVLSSSPDYKTNSTVMVLPGCYKQSYILFWKTKNKRDKLWINERSHFHDPNSAPSYTFPLCTLRFISAVYCRGKFYALSEQGTLAVIDPDSKPVIEITKANRAVPSFWGKGTFKEHFVEFRGEIMLIFLVSSNRMDYIVDGIEVYRLDIENMAWVKMESLGDRTFFIGASCCMPVCASELGCRPNCVYFKQSKIDGWWMFDMEGGSIQPGWNDDSTDKSPTWVTPTNVVSQ